MNISDIADDYLIDVPIEIGTLSPQVKDRKEGMKKLTAGFLNEVMQLEAENQIQARPYEQTGKRRVHCNGTRSRKLKTIYGEIELDKPQIREFPFKTAVFERFSRVEEFSSDFYSPWPGPRSQAPLGPSLPTIRPSGPLVPAPHACVRPPARAKAPAWIIAHTSSVTPQYRAVRVPGVASSTARSRFGLFKGRGDSGILEQFAGKQLCSSAS